MKKVLPVILMALILCVNAGFKKQPVSDLNLLSQMIANGRFSDAEHYMNKQIKLKKHSLTIRQVDSLRDQMHRIKRDFCLTGQQVREKLTNYYPNLSDTQLLNWETQKKIECRVIDGQKWYFESAVPNLFRLDPEAAKVKVQKEGSSPDVFSAFKINHTSAIIKETSKPGELTEPRELTFEYTLTVKPDAVKPGEIIRCWLPFPRQDETRQQNVLLLKNFPEKYILSPINSAHRTIYFEQVAQKGKPTVFSITVQLKTFAQYFGVNPQDIQPYKKESSLYKINTCQRPTEIVFSKRICNLTKEIVGNETNPFLKAQKIYTWINDHITWASALEYSTVPHIPEYVLDNNHGDCGMQTLLFMTMARYEGIPTHWQTGFMLHPGEASLHDWCEAYFEGIGWIPVDQSFNLQDSADPAVRYFYTNGIDSYRLIVNRDFSQPLIPAKIWPRSESVDFQRGEVETRSENLYFDKWKWNMKINYLNDKK